MLATLRITDTRRALLSRVRDARAETDALFQIVKPEALYDRPIAERHRIVFYIGHLEAFDWNLLSGACNLTSDRPNFDRLFAFGIDPVGGGLPTDQPGDWPSLDAVYRYRDRIRAELDTALENLPASQDGHDPFERLLHVAIEHRLMHSETLSYMFHQLPFDSKRYVALQRVLERTPFQPQSVCIPGGTAKLGLNRDAETFGWDNEFDSHSVEVPEFEIDKYKVTNEQFLHFIESGGYDHREFWSEPGWAWRTGQNIRYPSFWIPHGNAWNWRSMFEEIPLPLDWPVYVSHAEASAYARWAGKSLPSEAQWHRAAQGTNEPPAVSLSWDPIPVNQSKTDARSDYGVEGLLANGWEWTSTIFAPFPGFRPFDCYPGYSEPFFDGRHYVLQGGSPRTAACMLRRSFRNWFQPHYQYAYAGFRCTNA